MSGRLRLGIIAALRDGGPVRVEVAKGKPVLERGDIRFRLLTSLIVAVTP